MNINCYINAKVYFKMACVRVRVRVRVRAYPHFPATQLDRYKLRQTIQNRACANYASV